MSEQDQERALIEQRARRIYDNAEALLAKGLPENDVRQKAEWAAFTARAMSALSGLSLYSGRYEDALRALQIAEMAEGVLLECSLSRFKHKKLVNATRQRSKAKSAREQHVIDTARRLLGNGIGRKKNGSINKTELARGCIRVIGPVLKERRIREIVGAAIQDGKLAE